MRNASHAGFDPALWEPWSRVFDLLGSQQRPVPGLEKAHGKAHGKAWNTVVLTSFNNNATIKNPRICHPAASIVGHQSHYRPKATRSLSLERDTNIASADVAGHGFPNFLDLFPVQKA